MNNLHNEKLIEETYYELPESFINMVENDYNESENITDLDDLIQTWNESNSDILFNDSNGVYIPKMFADMILNEYVHNEETNVFTFHDKNDNEVLATFSGIDKEDLTLLSENDATDYNPDLDYWDIWNMVENNAELHYKGKQWYLNQDGDLWIRTYDYIDTMC